MASLDALPAAVALPRSHSQSLPRRLVVTYAVPLAGVAVMWHMVGFYYLKYATDVLAIAPGVVGAIFGASRVWDAISDPVAGYASDRTRSRLGRRRPWILAAALPLPLCFVAMWWPVDLQGGAQVAWVVASTFLFYTALTVFRIPHLSLGAELTSDGAARTKLFASVEAADVAGGLVGIGILFAVVGNTGAIQGVVPIVLTISLCAALLMLWCGSALREPNSDIRLHRATTGAFSAFRDVWRNPHARVLVIAAFLPTLGLICASTTAPYLADYALQDPSMLAGVLLAFALGTLSSLPFCAPIAGHVGKRRTWRVARSLQAIAMAMYFWAPALGFAGLVCVSLFAGFMEGLGGVVMRSLQADVIDWDAARSGERREGTYFAVWNLAAKTALGVAVFVVGMTLQAVGFQAGDAQSDASRTAILLLMSAAPCVFLLGAVLAFRRFSLPELR